MNKEDKNFLRSVYDNIVRVYGEIKYWQFVKRMAEKDIRFADLWDRLN
jgi:hypothetical protein